MSLPAIPDLKLRLGNTAEDREWNKLREAILSLWRRPEDPARLLFATRRQFALYQAPDLKIMMRQGTLLDTYRTNDNSTPPLSSWYMVGTEMGGAIESTPIALTVATGTHGFWLQFTHGTASANSTGVGRNGDVGFPQVDTYSAVELVAESSYQDGTRGVALVASGTNKSFIFLGTVVVDGAGLATITQSTFGPLHTPAISYLGTVKAGSSSNLEIASDGGLKVLASSATTWNAKAGPVDTGSDVHHTHT